MINIDKNTEIFYIVDKFLKFFTNTLKNTIFRIGNQIWGIKRNIQI